MNQFHKIILVIMDSVGIGALEDASEFGDEGANTVGHILEKTGLNLPNLCQMGLGEVTSLAGSIQKGAYGKLAEISSGKDTTSGHWELMGVPIKTPFKTFPKGFPSNFIQEFEKKVGRKTVCNLPASGTEVIQKYGAHHEKTGDLIVYTSADSVFQIAGHEEVIPLSELLEICQIARELLMGENQVARVIARPFLGELGNYKRTSNRRDYSVKPPLDTLLDKMTQKGIPVIGIGKIGDIFAYQGITYSIKTKNNLDGIHQTIKSMKNLIQSGLIFTNLVDFDMLYGHRRDPIGYKNALEEFDSQIPDLIKGLGENDLLLITADHGNDPTFPGTDHTREYVPILAYHPKISSVALGRRSSFSDVGATIGENFGISLEVGKSFLNAL